MHRKIQRGMGSRYQAEVMLKLETELGPALLCLEGRADGIFQEDDRCWIDEIKGTYRDVLRLEEPVYVHKAQAMCYAYMYAVRQGLEEMGVQMTYVNLETEQKQYFRETFSIAQLQEWFDVLKAAYERWAVFLRTHGQARDQSIRALEFPYPYREGQRELAVSVYRAIAGGRNLMIQAATGIGKTLSVVFPAVKAVGEGLADKIFYMTAKTITRTVAEETLEILREKGLRLSSVTLTAKEKICPCEQTDCNPVFCQRAAGHFDRVNDAVYDLITHTSFITRQDILEYGEKHCVCPFELSLDVSYWVDLLICDYNYVFDPDAYLRRFFGEGVSGDYLFLVDEAHNLVERAREMYSASLDKEDFLEVRRALGERHPALTRLLTRCNQLLLDMKRECDDYVVLEQVNQLILPLSRVYGELERFMEDAKDAPDTRVLDFYFKLRSFLNIYDLVDAHYKIYTTHREDGRFMVKLFCINPSANLQQRLSQGVSTIFFSATLLPVGYYKELLTGNQEEYAVYARSPFPAHNRLICVADDVSSRYTRRGRHVYERIWRYLEETVRAKPGNYMAFFPSYQFMEQVAACNHPLTDVCLAVQTGRMDEQKREEFLQYFRQTQPDGKSVLGFCVMGGIFSEGIDLKGDALIGAFIIGTGLPQLCTEREIIRQYYEEEEKSGFDYAYRYPGLNKVLQAAGRVIRTAEDKGVILLLDDRFIQDENRSLFPREWEQIYRVRAGGVGQIVRNFWNS